MTEAVPTPKNSIDSRLRQRAEEHMLLGLLALRCHAEVLAYMEIISLEEFSQNRLAAALPGILECLKRNCPLAPSTCPDPCMRCVVCRLQVAGVPVKLLTVRLLTAGGSCKADSRPNGPGLVLVPVTRAGGKRLGAPPMLWPSGAARCGPLRRH